MNTILEIRESPSFENQRITRFEEHFDRDLCERFSISIQSLATDCNRTQGEIIRKTIEPSRAKELINSISNLSIVVCPPDVLGLDGSTTELIISRGLNECRLTWWGSIPDQWSGLSDIIVELNRAYNQGRFK